MNNDILDHEEKLEVAYNYNRSKKFLKISALLVLAGFISTFAIVILRSFPDFIMLLFLLLLLSIPVFSLIGFVFGIRSYLAKERHRADRFLILIGNLLIAFIFIMMIGANMLDLMRAMS